MPLEPDQVRVTDELFGSYARNVAEKIVPYQWEALNDRLPDETIDLIARAQEDDGYLNTYITIEHPENRWKNLAEGHELYGCGHLIEAAVAYLFGSKYLIGGIKTGGLKG